MKGSLSCLVAAVAMAAPSSALADSPWIPRVTGELLNELPLGFGGSVDTEFPFRVRFGATFLYLPAAYVDLAETIAQDIGDYDDITSALIRATTEDALVFRLRAGYRPFEDYGFYVDFTYSLLTLGGAITSADLLDAAGINAQGAAITEWKLGSTVHQLGFEIGWRFDIIDRVSARVALGGSFTVAANVTAEVQGIDRPNLAAGLEEAGELYLEETILQYVHVPVITVAVGYDIIAFGDW